MYPPQGGSIALDGLVGIAAALRGPSKSTGGIVLCHLTRGQLLTLEAIVNRQEGRLVSRLRYNTKHDNVDAQVAGH